MTTVSDYFIPYIRKKKLYLLTRDFVFYLKKRTSTGSISSFLGFLLRILVNKPKIFGIGLSKTGKHSLSEALRNLGYNVGYYPKLDEIMLDSEKYDCLLDIPVILKYKALDKKYPDAKFILTVRNLDKWLKSCEIHFASKKTLYHKKLRVEIFGAELYDKEKFTNAWNRHINKVKEYFKGREEDLLIIDIPSGEGYNKLMAFLGVDYEIYRDKLFPIKNDDGVH